ncbi:MAG TPA: dodecin family protein, partial [Anaeromyxobacteraceae bacterium]|nr:dodecin family protein [Anaeromyxobacteraceae bacterium]
MRLARGLVFRLAACRAWVTRGPLPRQEEPAMPSSVYKVIEIVGSSPESWEKAAQAALDKAGKSLRDLRV